MEASLARLFSATLKAICAGAVLLSASPSLSQHSSKYQVNTDECGGDASPKIATSTTPSYRNKAGALHFAGKISFRRNKEDAQKNRCHVVYRLLLSEGTGPAKELKRVEWDTEEDEIAGIDLIGFSPDQSKFAADFWLAEGDSQEHRPVVYDLTSKDVQYRALGDAIQRQIHVHGCDQVEDFLGVANSGEGVFAVPPSVYDDSPECGDKGLWHFNLKIGKATRAAKISGDKWK